uniref:Integrase catalytic domain-containing protein n=1 Tax=Cajanus cajan TaxID=3821 RepID=A0A151R011_CAJCA|nr:hypothetical protein KK1_042990 [Cajanus cajan]
MLKKIGEVEVRPTRMTLQLVDRSIRLPHGIVEDMIVKVDKFMFLVDFVVMDMEEDSEVPLILGRPFMKTAKVIIDVDDGKLKVRVQADEVNFNFFEAMKHPNDKIGCFRVDVIDEVCMEAQRKFSVATPLEKALVNAVSDTNEEEEKEIQKCLEELDKEKEISPNSTSVQDLKNEEESQSQKLELKQLPSHLKYVFLEENGGKLVIISSSLSMEEEKKLVEVLKVNEGVIGWTLVRKEVIKLLEARMIYPIFDSAWVSPVQVVPKKGGMTVVMNDKNELIPTRTVTGWRMCIDYRKLNQATRKDHFPYPSWTQLAAEKEIFFKDSTYYVWDDPYLFKIGADVLLRRCVSGAKVKDILWHCHNSPYGGHYTTVKILQSGFYWPTIFKDSHKHYKICDKCQRTGGISKRHELPLQNILEVEVFDCWGIDFVGPLPSSYSNEYILVSVDYVSKWVEAMATQKADARTVIKFLKKNIFTRFGTPRVLISDDGSHFCNKQLKKVELKRILEKTVASLRKDWALKLDDTLWAYRTAYKTPIGLSPYHLVYGKSFHLLVELKHRAYWALKALNFNSRRSWMVNGHRIKPYLGGEVEKLTTVIHLNDP